MPEIVRVQVSTIPDPRVEYREMKLSSDLVEGGRRRVMVMEFA